jgi:hypothetical protein
MKAVIPAGERSAVLSKLLEKEITLREHQFYKAALELEANQGLKKEMQNWDTEFMEDGLDNA